ncbi:MAG: hypothetical protein WCY43_03250 [Patescibacteria group bacterium]|nr:hypothetical protein [Patescibacteria group bacterium]
MKRRKKIVKQAIELFDFQINKLASLDVPAFVMTDPLLSLMEFKEKIISRIKELDNSDYLLDVWFVPVIPFDIIRVSNQVQFLQFNGNKGYSYFDNDDIENLITVSQTPYYLWGVNNDSSNSRVPVDSEKFLTLSESLALCLHSNILNKYYVKALNSFLKTVKDSPVIHVYRGEHPKVDWDYFEDQESSGLLKEARPFCLERIF